jgi:hypothetical protein
MCEKEYCSIHLTGRKNFDKMVQSIMENAEGPESCDIITKTDYKDWLAETGGKASHRDRCMEAYENGNGRSIYV